MNRKIVDYETGEIIENVSRVITEDEDKKIRAYKQLQQQRKSLRDLMKRHCGGFYFYRYDKLIEQLNDDTATAFRFLYLCACADSDGRIVKYNNEYCCTKEDFTYIFDRPLRTVRKYVDDLLTNKLLYKDGAEYKLNPMYYSIGMDDSFKRNSIRTFNKAIKELYYNSDPKEHKVIGKILKLVPFINIYNNVLCWNIEETDEKLIQPLTLRDIMNIVHPGTNYSYDVVDKLQTLFIKGEPVLGNFSSVKQQQYIINPRLFYRGNNVEDLRAVIEQFDISKYQYLRKKKKKIERKNNNDN